MTPATVARYLIGKRDAILTVARCPQALWIGLLFVIAAGFAREYDGEDLLHEPWHLAIPLVASVVSSAVLYLLLRLVAWRRGATEPVMLHGYLTFLSLYWMTAPLALLYAIPFERFASAGQATEANLWLLALVATSRVLLISRVISVLYNASFGSAWFVVMLFADSILLIVLTLTPVPIFAVMGGIRLSESEAVLALVTFLALPLAFLSWFVWLVGFLGVVALKEPGWRYELTGGERGVSASRSIWMLAGGSIAAWAVILPFTQPEQRLRHRVEAEMRAGRIESGLEIMSGHERGDFPPHWDPPPRIGYRERLPDVTDVVETLEKVSVKPWVRKQYTEKFLNELRGRYSFTGIWVDLSPVEIDRRLGLVERLPNRAEAAAELREGLYFLTDRSHPSEEIRDRAARLIKEAEEHDSAASDNAEQSEVESIEQD